jgi:two-component system alkaline phosphatase synthesis response regulator PhoP
MDRRVLLVEDEPGLVLALSDRLECEGFQVVTAGDGESGTNLALAEPFDLIILDVGLPKRSGFEVCRKLRAQNVQTPILMLTARGEVVDKVVGLQAGADDYLTKPFDMMELQARIEALLRRAQRSANGGAVHQYRFGNVEVDFRSGDVKKDGEAVSLSAREFQLLKYLIEHRGAVISRDELLTKVWGYEALPETRTVDVHMAWLRQKLEPNPRTPEFILTLRGLGYKFNG